MSDELAGRVRVGGIFTAVARAIGAAPRVFLLVWMVRLILDALVALLRAQNMAPATLGALGTWLIVLSWARNVALAMVSGLLIRWLLGPRRDPLRFDVGLAIYVILISVAYVPPWLVILALRHRALAGGLVLSGEELGWQLVMAALALWPIALMMGDPIRPRRAVELMAPAYWPWIVTMFALALPALAWGLIPPLLHMFHPGLGQRMIGVVLSAFTSTVAAFALAYVYARRVRGMALPGADGIGYPPEAA